MNVNAVFGIPGSNMSLFYELAKDKRIKTFLSKNECGAAFMANGYTKATGKISACFGSTGPGATNLTTGVSAAYEDSQPIIVLAGQVGKKLIGKNAFQESSGKGGTINQFGIFKNITKYSGKIYSAKDSESVIEKAFYALKANRPGPAYLEIAADIMNDKVEYKREFFKSLKMTKYKEKRNKLKIAAKMVSKAKKPLILAGGGALYNNADEEVKRIAEKLSCPVATTMKGKGIISENHKLCLGLLGRTGQTAAKKYFESGVDLLLAVGVSFNQFTITGLEDCLKRTKIIRVDCEKKTNKICKEKLIKGDIKSNLRLMIPLIKVDEKVKEKKINKIKEFKQKGYFNYAGMKEKQNPIKPHAFFTQLRECLPNNAILCSESVGWTGKYFKTLKPRTHIVSTTLAPISCSLPEAIGAKIGLPSRLVLSIQGDCGFQMQGMELMTASSYKIPIVAIVLNNGILGPIYKAQMKKYGKAFMSELENPDFIKLAESFRMHGFKINKFSQIKKTLRKALHMSKAGSPVLIEVLVSKDVW